MNVIFELIVGGAAQWWPNDCLLLGKIRGFLWLLPAAILSILSGKAITHWLRWSAGRAKRQEEDDNASLRKTFRLLIAEQMKCDECLTNQPRNVEEGEVADVSAKAAESITPRLQPSLKPGQFYCRKCGRPTLFRTPQTVLLC